MYRRNIIPRIGDTVKCVDTSNQDLPLLNKREHYTVGLIRSGDRLRILFKDQAFDNLGVLYAFNSSRFRLIRRRKKSKKSKV
jgi:hypothetical protein